LRKLRDPNVIATAEPTRSKFLQGTIFLGTKEEPDEENEDLSMERTTRRD
jgi:hypothetical protein